MCACMLLCTCLKLNSLHMLFRVVSKLFLYTTRRIMHQVELRALPDDETWRIPACIYTTKSLRLNEYALERFSVCVI